MKLYAYSQDQQCAIVNHCLPALIPYVGGIICSTSLRHNLRTRDGSGAPAGETNGMIGDCLLSVLPILGCFTGCQELRSVPVDAWSWWDHLDELSCMRDPCIYPGCKS
eukprot:TRINITY_DN2697_c0_g1_i1.p2 TRINITY_DN2697_c0_g1~~TRINITY_DN2697_c0_g1_i1.p2  ORF type:complete len:108 (+),score=6.47 TRINITY_DN2697_c0_g1_i1:370-693(+)